MRDRFEFWLSNPRGFVFLCAMVATVYLCSAIGDALTKCPWWDEGMLARPAYNLAFHGHLGNDLFDPVRNFDVPVPPDLAKYTYWMPPLYFLALAGWFKVFGFSLFLARAFSVLWGFALLVSWYSIVKSLTGRREVALLAAGLIAADYSVPISCANVRADAMTAALGCAALALYLRVRERNLSRAVLAGASLTAAATLSHPLGLIWAAALAGLILHLDLRRLRWVHLLLSAAPFAAGGAGWGFYILQSPSVFVAQFWANAGYRTTGFASPFTAIVQEFGRRYLTFYFPPGSLMDLVRLKVLVLVAYFGALAAVVAAPAARRLRGAKALALVAIIVLVLLAVLDNKKLPGYFVHVLPPLASLCALAAWWLWSATRVPKALIAAAVAGLMTLQLGGTALRISGNPYQNIYRPVVNFVTERVGDNAVVIGPAQLFFGLPPGIRLVDDLSLGYRSGVQPDLIVGDDFLVVPPPAQAEASPIRRHVRAMLTEAFRPAFRRGNWNVYVRRQGN